MDLLPKLQIINGPHPSSMPPVGIGTYELRGEETVIAVREALRIGFRLVDTAAVYRNEQWVGEGIRQSGVPRDQLFIVVKVAMKSMKSKGSIREGILKSIELLGIEYADSVLVHWPGCGGLKPNDTGNATSRKYCWEVLHELQLEGKIMAIGVSNYYPKHFRELAEYSWASSFFDSSSDQNFNEAMYLPVINQIELHPLCVQEEIVSYCRSHGIHLQQYSPLGKRDDRLFTNSTLLSLRETVFPEYSVADILLLWGLSQGFCPLIRSRNPAHVMANWRTVLDFFSIDDTSPSRQGSKQRVLGTQQRDVLLNLREHLGIQTDDHLCWDSIQIV